MTARPRRSPGPGRRRPCTPTRARQVSRSRLPAAPRAGRLPARRPRTPAGPRTTAAPFAAVPSPEPRLTTPSPAELAVGAPRDRSGRLRAGHRPSQPLAGRRRAGARVHRPQRLRRLPLGAAPAPRAPADRSRRDAVARATATGPSPPAPSELDLRGRRPAGAAACAAPAPGTSLIPERRLSRSPSPAGGAHPRLDRPRRRRRRPSTTTPDDRAPAPVRGPASGPVMGGRAAMRAERQAADMARRKAEKRTGSGRRRPRRARGRRRGAQAAPGRQGPPRDDRRRARRPRRLLVRVAARPRTPRPTSPATASRAGGRARRDRARCRRCPARRSTSPPSRPPRCARRSRCSTPPRTNGLAAKAAAAFGAAGWETPGVGGYTGDDVAASTVFFTEGDETQRQAAVQLVDAVPAAAGPGGALLRAPGRRHRARPGRRPDRRLAALIRRSPDRAAEHVPPLVRWPQRALPPRARASPPALRRPRDARRPARPPAARRCRRPSRRRRPPPTTSAPRTPGCPPAPAPTPSSSTPRPTCRPAAAGAPAVVLAHGFGGSKDSVADDARDLAERGYVVLTYSARGFGRSTGQIGLDDPRYEVADLSTLIDRARRARRRRSSTAPAIRGSAWPAAPTAARCPCSAPPTTTASTRSRRRSPGTR